MWACEPSFGGFDRGTVAHWSAAGKKVKMNSKDFRRHRAYYD